MHNICNNVEASIFWRQVPAKCNSILGLKNSERSEQRGLKSKLGWLTSVNQRDRFDKTSPKLYLLHKACYLNVLSYLQLYKFLLNRPLYSTLVVRSGF